MSKAFTWFKQGYLSKLLTISCILSFSSFSLASEEDFPVPDSLLPAIQFWVRVYTEVDTKSGFLHDSQDLGIVYLSLDRDSKLINDTRTSIKADLTILASGKRSGLTPKQEELLSLWPADVSNERLSQAVDNVRWQLGQSDRFVAGLKRSGAYRAHIESVVSSKNMPLELASLPHVESSFHPGAYSSAAATGMWQFVRSTATRFMQVDYVVDERLDAYRATYGAMSLLEYNYNALGSWPLALTAYNHGAAGMARAVENVGSSDIGVIISQYKGSRFGFASRNFYPQFLAVQEVESRTSEFFGNVQFDSSPTFDEQEMIAYVAADAMAQTLGVSTEVLKRDNPALQPSVWSGTKRIPKGYVLKVNQNALTTKLLSSFDALPDSVLFAQQIPDLSYIVSRGDSLSVIADRFSTSISELVAINQLRDRHRIRIGQTLLLPQPDGAIPDLLIAASEAARVIPRDGIYTVQRGDTLSTIAERFRVSVANVMSMNRLNNQSVIYPGQSLNLTAGQTTLASVAEQAAQESDAIVVDMEENDTEIIREIVVLEQLSLDSNNLALEVGEVLAAVEESEQLSVDLSLDPTNYSVASDNSIEVQAIETLGHYADWLGVRAQQLRNLNNLAYGEDLLIGGNLRLDFSAVDVATFETRRKAFHRDLQSEYFSQWQIESTEEYSIQRRDFLHSLARERSVPMWLFRQYNPEVDSSRLQIGQVIVFPVVEKVSL